MPIFSTSITISDLVVEMTIPKNTIADRKANSLFYPIGPGYSEAWLVVSGKTLNVLSNATNKNASHTIKWGIVTTSTSSSRQPEVTTSSFPGWRFINAERVLQGGPNQQGSLFLCCFRDVRYLASINSDSGAIRANIRSYAQDDNYLTGTDGYTWTSFVTELWNAVGQLGAFPGMPIGLLIDAVPETWFFTGHNAWATLNAALEFLDCAISPNPLLGTFSIVRMGAEQLLPATLPQPQQNFEPVKSNVDCAATLKFYFNKHYKNYGQEKDTELTDNWAYNGWGSSSSQATNITGAIGVKPLWQDMPIVIGEDGTDENTSDRSTRMTNATSRYVTRVTSPVYHRIYSRINTQVLPGGTIKAIIFRNYDDAQNDYGGTVTEWVAKPDYVRGLSDVGSSSNLSATSLAQSNLLPPDLGQHSYPNYPRLPQLVQVHHSSGSPGTTVSANADGLHPGFVQRMVNGVMTELEECWILFVDNYDVNNGHVDGVQDEFYLGRLMGIKTSEGTTNPLYVVKKGGESGSSITMFYLLERLYLDREQPAGVTHPNNVKAKSWSLDPDFEGEDIQVYDPYNYGAWIGSTPIYGMFNGFIGFRGCAVKLPFDYEADGESALWMLSLDSNWWKDAGEVVLEINGDNTGTIVWPHDDFNYPPPLTDPDAANTFLANLQAELDSLLGVNSCNATFINDYPGLPVTIQLQFGSSSANMAITVSIDSWSNEDGTATEPTLLEINGGSDEPVIRPAYEIIWMERMPQWIEFTTTSRMSEIEPGAVTVTITKFDNQGKFADIILAPPIPPYETAIPVPNPNIVYDSGDRFLDVRTDCKGYATYDNHLDKYFVQQCQRMCIFIYGTLITSQMCPTDEENPTVNILEANKWQTGEFVADPPETAEQAVLNTAKLAGINGDVVLLRRITNDIPDATITDDPIWEIVNVQPHEFEFVTDVALDTSALIQTKVTGFAYWCGAGETTTTIVGISECPPPE